MNLPYISSNLLAWFDPAEKYVIYDNNFKVSSVQNRAGGLPFTQFSQNQKPVWGSTSLGGKYPGITYTGNNSPPNAPDQRLAVPVTPSIVSNQPLIITCAIQFTQPSNIQVTGIPVSVGNNLQGPVNYVEFGTQIFFGGGQTTGISPYLFADNQTFTQPFTSNFKTPIDANIHVYTIMFDGNNFFARMDGYVVASAPKTFTGTYSFNTITIGNSCFDYGDSFAYTCFRGTLGPCLVYQGKNINFDAETFIMRSVGL